MRLTRLALPLVLLLTALPCFGAAPSITSLSPTYGPPGTSVTITGTGFGTTQGSSTVTFNGVAATPTSWSSTSIVVPVPSSASSGNVVVTVSGTPSNSVNFTVTLWANAYGYRRSITVSHTKVPNTDQISFPLLISGTFPYLATTANGGNVINPNGYDVVFTSDPAGTLPLPYERESYNPSSGQVIFWVQIPDLSHTTDTTIYMFCGNSAITTDQSRPSSVWDSNYQGVWHLPNGTELNAADSTSNNNYGDIEGATATTGEIGGGASFNGLWDYIVGASTVNAYQVTVEAWVNLQSLPSSNALVAGFVNGLGNGTYDRDIIINSSGHAEFEVNSGGQKTTPATSALGTGTWAFLVGTADGSHANIYLNGSLAGNVSAGYSSYNYTVPDIFIGGASSAYTYLKANIDEVRVSSIARSADWIATEYNNQSSPSAFYTIGSPVSGGSEGIAGSGIVSVGGSEQSGYVCDDAPDYIVSQDAQCGDDDPPQGPIYDYGEVTLTINGVGTSGSYGANDTPASVAASLASAVNATSGMPVTATVIDNNGDIELVANGVGPTTDYSVSCSESSNSSPPFNSPSFWAACASLTGGALIPTITSLSPTSGTIGTSVTITGTNFGSTQGSSTVTFNGIPASPTSWSATSIVAPVPAGATSGNVVVSVSGLASNGASFTVTGASPSIASLSPTSGVVGTMVAITGTDFGPSEGSSTVTFNGTTAMPQTWTSSSITVTVPYGATSGNVVVTVSGVASNGIGFSVISWSGSYAYRSAITIDHGNIADGSLTNFPVLISGTYSYLATTANGGNVSNANGYDIVFTSDAAGTQVLPYERESYSASTGQVIFWVQVPSLSDVTDTVIYMFYGNPSVTTDQSNKTGVWDSNFVGVWHLPNGSTLSASDSTSNGNNGTISGATATAGEIDGGASLNGSSYISISPSGSLSGTYTIEAWAKPSQIGSALGLFGSRTPHDDSFGVILNSTGLQGDIGTGSNWLTTGANATFSYASGTWYHFVYVVTPGAYSIYANGDLIQTGYVSSGTPLLFDSNHQLRFGATGASGQGFKGSLDEVRVSKVARSSAWIGTQFNNQSNPSGFYSIGPPSTGGAAIPAITSLSPTSGGVGTSVTITGANFGASQGSSTVTFNGTSASVCSTCWGATSIVVPVPSGATTGNVVVTVGGAASNGVSFTVTSGCAPPSAPSALTATASSSSQINLSWTASTAGTGCSITYSVFRSTTSGFTPSSSNQIAAGVTTTSYSDTGLAASTTYYYLVEAADSGGTSGPSNQASATTQASCSAAPSAPSGLTATAASSSQINLSWTASTAGTGCSITYSVFRSTTSGFTPSSSNQIATGVTTTSYSNTGLAASTTYYYLVEATDSGGTSGPSNQASATTLTGQLQITTTSLPTGTQGASYSATLQATGGQPPYTWSSSGSLPDSLQLSASGAITGTPPWSGSENLSVVVTDTANATASATLSITINPVSPPASTGSIAYTYDSQGRVLTATYTTSNGSTVTVTYSYDNAGNRTSVVTQ